MPVITETAPAVRSEAVLAPRWHVILLNDEEHTFTYVVEMLGAVFGHSAAAAWEMALAAHSCGRAVVYTGPRETAEFKQQRVHAYGPDWRMRRSAGSCTALLRPAD
ncbi:MAG: ATP-dependent Clp protease adaptor ClpS [Planctomycetota bacterium]|nr:MAG: ATP-dependent Clp protease adaptor ClpS [Planctomycetota bacterium]